MKFDILTLFPEMFTNILNESIIGRAVKNKIVEFSFTNIRDFSGNKHNRVDDYPYGGGQGMVMMPQCIYGAYNSVAEKYENKPHTVYLSPKGAVFTQDKAKELAKKRILYFYAVTMKASTSALSTKLWTRKFQSATMC